MTTTVTTTVVTTTAGSGTWLVLVAIATLIVLILLKDVASGLSSPRAARLNRYLDVALIPLAVVFVGTFTISVLELLI